MKTKLTAQFLDSLKAREHPFYVSDSQTVGLRVRVSPAGVKTWNVAYRVKGEPKARSLSLGNCDTAGKEGRSLGEARERAADIVKAARIGRDLLKEEADTKAAVKAEQDAAITVDDLITLYSKSINSPKRNGGPLRTAAAIEARIKRTLADHLSKNAEQIRRADLSKVLDEFNEDYPREAEKRRQSTGAMFRWALAKGYVTSDPTAGTASYGRGDPRVRKLDKQEIRAVWNWLAGGAGDMPPDCIDVLKLQFCLGARVGEVAGMSAEEVFPHGDHWYWVLPASRAKNKQERTTPLLGPAREIMERVIQRRPKGSLFRTLHTDRVLTSSDVGHALKKRPELPCADFNTHDIRRTVVSQLDEMGISLDTIAMIVGHQRGTKDTRTLVRHYAQGQHMDRVEAALEAWNTRLLSIVSGEPETNERPAGGNVINMSDRIRA